MSWIARAWKGNEKLWKVFWLYGIATGIAFSIVGALIVSVAPVTPVLLAYGAFRFAYAIWLVVSEWRCAYNVTHRIWGTIMRAVIVISLVMIVLGLVIGGLLVGQDLIKAAECRKEEKAYLAQGGTDTESFRKNCEERHRP